MTGTQNPEPEPEIVPGKLDWYDQLTLEHAIDLDKMTHFGRQQLANAGHDIARYAATIGIDLDDPATRRAVVFGTQLDSPIGLIAHTLHTGAPA